MYGFAIFGIVALCVIVAVLLLGFLMNLPDLFRYLKIKSM